METYFFKAQCTFHFFMEKTGVLRRIYSISLCCHPQLQFWTLGRQGQGSYSKISHRKLCLSKCLCNLIIKGEEKMTLFSDTCISSGPSSRPYPLKDVQMKCFKLTFYVKFTLLKRKLCFGGYFKGKLVWTWAGFFSVCTIIL